MFGLDIGLRVLHPVFEDPLSFVLSFNSERPKDLTVAEIDCEMLAVEAGTYGSVLRCWVAQKFAKQLFLHVDVD